MTQRAERAANDQAEPGGPISTSNPEPPIGGTAAFHAAVDASLLRRVLPPSPQRAERAANDQAGAWRSNPGIEHSCATSHITIRR